MLDNVSIAFDPSSQAMLNLLLALLMFGVALSLKPKDFKRILFKPIAPIIGLLCQFVLLPLLTYVVTMLLNVPASMALGMILVAACPGGNFSNLITFIAKGNVATSVTMTAFSSTTAVLMTPLNFSFYTYLNPATRELLFNVALQPSDVMSTVLLVLAVPIALGLWLGARFHQFAAKTESLVRNLSLALFLLFVFIAFSKNASLFAEHWHLFIWYVIAQNTLALGLGYAAGKLCKLAREDVKALTFEVGIQNSGLGLILLFSFMPNMGGAVIITAFWGVWHILSGTTLALIWAKKG